MGPSSSRLQALSSFNNEYYRTGSLARSMATSIGDEHREGLPYGGGLLVSGKSLVEEELLVLERVYMVMIYLAYVHLYYVSHFFFLNKRCCGEWKEKEESELVLYVHQKFLISLNHNYLLVLCNVKGKKGKSELSSIPAKPWKQTSSKHVYSPNDKKKELMSYVFIGHPCELLMLHIESLKLSSISSL